MWIVSRILSNFSPLHLSFFLLTLQPVFCCRGKEFFCPTYPSVVSFAHPGGSNEFLPLDKIHDNSESKSFSRAEEGPFQGATKWGEKRCAHLGLREREGEENRVNGIWGPRSGSSTLPRVVVKAISAGERAFECSGAKRDRERERGRGWEEADRYLGCTLLPPRVVVIVT